ncbi:hypothetical protein ALP12_200496 [Pseudomonas savastanoi pv. phaseolicola]|nr:hypothetical protein ALP12_200496 [Pseudomonas savastanoi pv. phaseolicola]
MERVRQARSVDLLRGLLRLGEKTRACIAASPSFIWCRHQESNPGPTDYKEGAFNLQINDLQLFLLRAHDVEAMTYVRSWRVITWHEER